MVQMVCCGAAGSAYHFVGRWVKKEEILGCAVCGLDGHTGGELNSVGVLGLLEWNLCREV